MLGLASKAFPWVKLIQPAIILLLVALLTLQTQRLGNRTEELAVEHKQRAELAPILGAQDNWNSIRTNARTIVKVSGDRKRTLDDISKSTLDAKKRADNLDEQLRQEQAANQKRLREAQKTIDALRNSKGSGSTIDEISKLPWTGWKSSTERKAEDGWRDPERLRADYNKLTPQFFKPVRIVQLIPHPSRKDLFEAFLKVYKLAPSDISKDFTISAFVVNAHTDGVCQIHVVDPLVQWNSIKRRSMGHELAHCIYGGWHA